MNEQQKPHESEKGAPLEGADITGQMKNTIHAKLAEVFSDNEMRMLCQRLQMAETEMRKNQALRFAAKEKGVSFEDLQLAARTFIKEKIRSAEKGELLHFHRTSFENLRSIASMGRLLSRSKLKELNPDIKLPGWSASDDVMMTRDAYDKNGTLYSPGFTDTEVVGASSRGATLVLDESIMNLDDYDALRRYPTVSDASLAQFCKVILVENDADKELTQSILNENGLQDIPVVLKSDWKR